MPPDASPLTTEFDREHLRLAHRQALGEGRGPEDRQRALESADQYRVGARVRAGLRPAASERVRGRARSVRRDVRHARHRRSERPDGAACRHLWSGRGATGCRPATRSRGSSGRSSPSDGRCVATILAAIRPSLQLPPLHPDVQAFLAAPIASPAHVYGWICLVGNEGRSLHRGRRTPGHGAVGTGRPHLRARTRDPRAQTGGVGPAPRAGPGAAIPGHGRGHPARPRPGRADHAHQPQGLRPPGMDRAGVARTRLDRDVPPGPDAGRQQAEAARRFTAATFRSSRTPFSPGRARNG